MGKNGCSMLREHVQPDEKSNKQRCCDKKADINTLLGRKSIPVFVEIVLVFSVLVQYNNKN